MNLQENNKLSEKLKKLIDENGFYQVQKMIGVNTTELVKLSGIPIDSVMANQILTENIVSKKIPTSYKNFEIQCDEFQGVVYWVGKFETKHYQSGMYEIVSFMATPFWDGESRVPIQLDYLELRSDRNDAIIQQIEGDGYFFESLDINLIFKNVDELLNWYEKFYLPKVHKIIMKKLLPEVYDYLDTIRDIGMRRLDEDILRIKSMMLLTEKENVDDKVRDIMLNADDWGDFLRALKLKYGKTIPLYHATTKETSEIIDREGFKLTYGKNYKSFAQEPLIYFQIGQSDYVASNRPVLYRLDVPLEFIGEYADIDMDNVDVSDEDLINAGFDIEYWDDMPYEIKDAITYFVWNNMSLDGMELLITDRNGKGDIFSGLEPQKVESLN